MPKFTLIAEHMDLYGKPTGQKSTHEFEHDFLGDILVDIDLFLRGAGFNPDGNLEYIQDKQYPEWTTEEFDTSVEHDESYFDTDRNR
jgi:hypothetical protein